MYFALGAAAAGALNLLSSLAPSKNDASKTGLSQSASPFDLNATASGSAATTFGAKGRSVALSPATFNALLAAQDANQPAKQSSAADALKDLFAQLDTDGNGKISKSEFEDKLGAGGTNLTAANHVFGKLDTDGDGAVSINELSNALMGKAKKPRHAHGAGGGQDALLKALEGAQSTSKINSDGSTTTTLTYANGTTVTMSAPAVSNTSASASSSYNLVERLIQKQADAISASAQQSISMKV